MSVEHQILLAAFGLLILLLSMYLIMRFGRNEQDNITIDVTSSGYGRSHGQHTHEDSKR